jgi:hypothetical protein
VNEVGFDAKLNKPICAPFIVWESDYVDITANEAMQAASENRAPGQKDKAKQFLSDLLTVAGGAAPVKEIVDAAAAELISKRSLERAKDDLQVVARQTRREEWEVLGKCWLWQLPQ